VGLSVARDVRSLGDGSASEGGCGVGVENCADDGVADTWIGMAFVLGGIALCVQSKNPAF